MRDSGVCIVCRLWVVRGRDAHIVCCSDRLCSYGAPRRADAQARLQGAPRSATSIVGAGRRSSSLPPLAQRERADQCVRKRAQSNSRCGRGPHYGRVRLTPETAAPAPGIAGGDAPSSSSARGWFPHTSCSKSRIQPGFRLTPSSSTLITVAAASTPTYSPPPTPRSSTLRVSDLRTQLRNVAAARIAALVRGRAARKVAHDARSLWVARRFRATPLRSIAATDIARVARSFLSRRHFGRGGENRAAAAADAAAHDATTSATPISAKPASRRGRRSSHTPTLVDDDSDDADGYADDDDDGSRSCLTPHSHLDLEYYSEMALACSCSCRRARGRQAGRR